MGNRDLEVFLERGRSGALRQQIGQLLAVAHALAEAEISVDAAGANADAFAPGTKRKTDARLADVQRHQSRNERDAFTKTQTHVLFLPESLRQKAG